MQTLRRSSGWTRACSSILERRTPVNARYRQVQISATYNEPHSSTSSRDTAPRVIFSGIQPTGIPHLGNYLGALQQWVSLQNDAAPHDDLYFSIVDLHSLTSRNQTPSSRRDARRRTLASLLAVGLSPQRSTLYFQSTVPQHAELHWILSCDASMGWLSRMTTWRAKLAESGLDAADLLQPTTNPKSTERLKLGLFSYPVLQAADILLYGATHVPVGEDQLVHIEFARQAALAFNHVYGGGGIIDPQTGIKRKGDTLLVPPESMVPHARRVMSLIEPTKKMSKSAPLERSRVLLTDSPDQIAKKFRGALTDGEARVTYDPETRPGIANLLEIIAYLDRKDSKGNERQSPVEVAQEFDSMTVQGSMMRVLKGHAAEVVTRHLTPIREAYEELMSSQTGVQRLDEIAETGRAKAESRAEKTMNMVRQAVGLS